MSRDLPLILFDTYKVFREASPLTSGLHPEHVAAVLDVVVRHARNEPVPAKVPDDATCEALIESSDMRWNGDHYYGDGGGLMDLVRAAMLAAIAKGGE